MPLGLLRHPQETVRGKWGRHLKCFCFLNRLSKQSSLGAPVIYSSVCAPRREAHQLSQRQVFHLLQIVSSDDTFDLAVCCAIALQLLWK